MASFLYYYHYIDILCNSIQYHGHLLETLSEEDNIMHDGKKIFICYFITSTTLVDTSGNTSQLLLKQLKDLFVKSVSSIVPLIANGVPSLNKLKLFLERAYVEMKPQLTHAETMDDVLILVIDKCSLINVSCLEAVIDHYDIMSAKRKLSHYMTEVDKFCEKTTVHQCVNESFRLSSSQLLYCDTVQFSSKRKLNECSLNEIKILKKNLFHDFADRVLICSIKSSIVTCYVPQHFRNCLLIESERIPIVIKREIHVHVQMICISSSSVWTNIFEVYNETFIIIVYLV